MWSGGRGVSICLRPFGLTPRDQGSGRDRRAHRPRRNEPLRPLGRTGASRSTPFVSGPCLLAEAEVGAVDPHPVQDDGELSGSPAGPWGPRGPTGRDLRLGHAAAPSDGQAPGAQRRPFRAAHQKCVRRLDQARSGELVAAAADPSDDIRLAGLISARPDAMKGRQAPEGIRSPEETGPAGPGGPLSVRRDRYHGQEQPPDLRGGRRRASPHRPGRGGAHAARPQQPMVGSARTVRGCGDPAPRSEGPGRRQAPRHGQGEDRAPWGCQKARRHPAPDVGRRQRFPFRQGGSGLKRRTLNHSCQFTREGEAARPERGRWARRSR